MMQTHVQLQAAVEAMIASLLIDQGMIDFEQEMYTESLTLFHRSHKMYKKLAANSGEHILANPLDALANTLSALGQYEEAGRHWRELIRITEAHVGVMHQDLCQPLANYAIDIIRSAPPGDSGSGRVGLTETQYRTAVDALMRAKRILDINKTPHSDTLYVKVASTLKNMKRLTSPSASDRVTGSDKEL